MRATVSTDLLLRFLHATPKQQAAIERILGGQALPNPERSPPPANETSQAAPPKAPEPDQESLSLAAKVLELLTALDPDNRLRKAPPIKVFNLYYRQRLGPAEIARKCNCDRSLIYDRLATIQEKVPWTPEQLQDVAPHVEAMQEALTDSRAEDIYRKGAAYGDEDGSQGDD
jgi:predicted DNA-binding protein YlxM (UPF0122 family)